MAIDRRRLALIAGWIACAAAAYWILAASGYTLRDPDSTLYESISAQLSGRPLREWIAPRFPPNRFGQGLFLEHLAAFFWPSAALDRLGFSRGALLANLIYFLGCLYFLYRLAAALAGWQAGWIAVACWLISPAGIQYLVRANHENAWAIAFLAGFFCLHQLPRTRWFGAGFALCGLCAFAVKGVLALVFFPVMFCFWLTLGRPRADLGWFALGLALVAAFAIFYELAFRNATGQSFFAGYLASQLKQVARFEGGAIWEKLSNPGYYLASFAWFALPGSILSAWSLWSSWRRRERLVPAQWLVVCGAGVLIALLSFMSRRAVRYVFPAYLVAQICGAHALLSAAPRVRGFIERRASRLPFYAMLCVVAFTAVRVGYDARFYRFVDLLGG